MSALARLQRDFFAALFEDVRGDDHGIAIYRRHMLGNQHEALAATFPVVRRLVGEAFFREAAARFSRARGSTSGDLNAFGAGWPDYLAGYPFAAGLPYLADVARLEWAVHESMHAAEVLPLDFTRLAAVHPDRFADLRFRMHPGLRLLRSGHPVLAIWEANQPERDGTPEGPGTAQCVLVRRVGFDARPMLLGEDDLNFLQALQAGATLEEAAAASRVDTAAIAALLARCASWQAIVGFDARAENPS